LLDERRRKNLKDWRFGEREKNEKKSQRGPTSLGIIAKREAPKDGAQELLVQDQRAEINTTGIPDLLFKTTQNFQKTLQRSAAQKEDQQ